MRVALGITESPFFTSGLKVSARWYAKDERSLPISIINTGSQIANAIAPPLLTFLLLTMSWRGMFLVVGAFGLLVAVVWMKVYRDPTLREEIAIKGAEIDEEAESRLEKASWISLLRQPNTWFMVIGAFGVFYTVWVYLTWLPSYLQTSRGFSLKEIGWVASLPFLCGILGVLTGGYVSSRLIKRGVRSLTARKIPIVGRRRPGRGVGAPRHLRSTTSSCVDHPAVRRLLLRPGTDRGHLDPRLRPRRKAPGRVAGRDPELRRVRRSGNGTHRHRHHPRRDRRQLHPGLPGRRHTALGRRRLLRILRQGPPEPPPRPRRRSEIPRDATLQTWRGVVR